MASKCSPKYHRNQLEAKALEHVANFVIDVIRKDMYRDPRREYLTASLIEMTEFRQRVYVFGNTNDCIFMPFLPGSAFIEDCVCFDVEYLFRDEYREYELWDEILRRFNEMNVKIVWEKPLDIPMSFQCYVHWKNPHFVENLN